jgi:hypothetical protein
LAWYCFSAAALITVNMGSFMVSHCHVKAAVEEGWDVDVSILDDAAKPASCRPDTDRKASCEWGGFG